MRERVRIENYPPLHFIPRYHLLLKSAIVLVINLLHLEKMKFDNINVYTTYHTAILSSPIFINHDTTV